MNTIDWKNASPEQKTIWNYILNTFAPSVIVLFVYQGVIAGSEFLTYNAAKLYFCLSIDTGYANMGSTNHSVLFYDETNAMCMIASQNDMTYDSTTPQMRVWNNTNGISNIYFSRIATSDTHMKFIGYRLTI